MKRLVLGVGLVLLFVSGSVTASATGLAGGAATSSPAVAAPAPAWTELQGDAPWAARAGLRVVSLRGRFFLMGGRTPNPPTFPPIPGDSRIWSDVWTSGDSGANWQQVLASDGSDHWAPRAYFGAVTMGDAIYVLGGQDYRVTPNPCPPGIPGCPPFVSTSTFFNDVWRSRDGVHWDRMTEHAPWEGRAGLSTAVFRNEIYVFGGSKNDDTAVIGGPPQRIYYNDVWKSRDGRTWERVTARAPWTARAGAASVVKGQWLYVLGGENGFTCEPLPGCAPPYFNDVWRTRNGRDWQLVTPAAGWSPRPGHVCVLAGKIVCFGGFGLLQNPTDMWESDDGARWSRLPSAPWNATSPDQVKYDFAAIAAPGSTSSLAPAIYTFGGDRETFSFTDPTNYLRVDNDVWRYQPN